MVSVCIHACMVVCVCTCMGNGCRCAHVMYIYICTLCGYVVHIAFSSDPPESMVMFWHSAGEQVCQSLNVGAETFPCSLLWGEGG